MQDISCLIFDLDNTLIDINSLFKQWLNSQFNNHPPSLSQDQYEPCNTPLLLQQVSQHSHIPYNDLLHDYQRYLRDNIQPNQQITTLLEHLKNNYKMALLTNGSKRNQQRKIQQAQLVPYFHTIAISAETGIRKPHPDSFLYLLKKLGCKAEEALFIGDCLHHDIEGANNAGIKTCWVSPHSLLADNTVQPDYQIYPVTKLKKLLSV